MWDNVLIYYLSQVIYLYLKGDLEVLIKEHLLNRIDWSYSVCGTLSSIIERNYLLFLFFLNESLLSVCHPSVNFDNYIY